MKILMLIMIVTSCGLTVPPRDLDTSASEFTFNTSNPSFDVYKAEFESEYAIATNGSINTQPIRINFVNDLEGSIVGQCSYWDSGSEIFIETEYWNNVSEIQRTVLIFHELGHCALKRGHRDSSYLGYKTSIMNSYNLPKPYLDQFRDSLYNELFTNNPIEVIAEIDLL